MRERAKAEDYTGEKRYPGLYSTEINTASQYFAFQNWTGIDCSGFVQRLASSAKGLRIPGVVCAIPDLRDTDNDGNHIDDGAIGSWQFTEIDRTYPIFADLSGSLKRGDILVYAGASGAISHVALVYCKKGDITGSCEDLDAGEYRIIHASGDRQVCYRTRPGQSDECTEFNRKVMLNTINSRIKGTLGSPIEIGRVKLWD